MNLSWHLKIIYGLFAVLTCLGSFSEAQTAPSWVRKSPQNHGVIVFVHGIMGDGRSTWTSGNAYWPEMITHDHTFDGQDVYVYHYSSPPFHQAFSIDQLAENMRLLLRTDGVLSHDEITFVCHSMGGIVTRAFILRNRSEVAKKIRLLYFFATPTTGNSYAQVARLFSDNPQFKQLLPLNNADSFLASQQSDWVDAKLSLRSYCGYETQGVHGEIIVERDSATNLCSEHIDPIDADHITIVKPKDTSSTPYRALAGAFMETVRATSPATGNYLPVAPPSKKSPERVFTNKTPLDLVRFFREGYTSIQSHELFDPYVGMWMHLHGRIKDTYPGNPGHGAIDVWYSPSLVANCYFANGWAEEVGRHIKGEEISVDGKIADFQTGDNQFFLTDCELPDVKIPRNVKSSSNPHPIASSKRIFTDKSIPDLMGLYRRDNTGIQNDKIIAPFKGLWIKSQGTIQYLAPDYKDHSIAVIIVSSWPVECRFPPSQKADLTRFSNNDTIQFMGKIAENQTYQELYLQTCELIKEP